MADDPIGKGLLLLIIVVGFGVAWRPEWFVKVLSFGRSDVRDVNRVVFRTTRIIALVSAVYGVAYLVWSMIQKSHDSW